MKQENKIEVVIPLDNCSLEAYLAMPRDPKALVIFSHGSASSRFSPRNNYVAEMLNRYNIATLLPDLLTAEEDCAHELRFDITLLTNRLVRVTEWALQYPGLKNLPIGYFGTRTGVASALNAAVDLKDIVKAVVGRGGQPDLAGKEALSSVTCPTLLIVGSLDDAIITLNVKACHLLNCEKEIIFVEGATHLFEEAGTLQKVAQHAASWFGRHLLHLSCLPEKYKPPVFTYFK